MLGKVPKNNKQQSQCSGTYIGSAQNLASVNLSSQWFGKQPTKELKQCPICNENLERSQLSPFSLNCLHLICKKCAVSHILNSIKDFKQIRCPIQGCTTVLDELSHLILQLPAEQQQKYYKILIFNRINNTPNVKSCPGEDCLGYFLTYQNPAKCVVCGIEYCPKCMLQPHRGQCEQIGIDFLENKFKYKKCKCGRIVEKSTGCDHMTCICNYQFCYRCGNEWSVEHRCVQRTIPNRNLSLQVQSRQEPIIVPKIQGQAINERVQRVDQNQNSGKQCLPCCCYFIFLWMVDLFLSMVTLIYCLLAFLAISLKGITYTFVLIFYDLFSHPLVRCLFGNIIRILVLIFVTIILFPFLILICMGAGIYQEFNENLRPHYRKLWEKRFFFPLYFRYVLNENP